MDARDMLLQRLTRKITRMREALDEFDDTTAERMLVNDDWNVRDLVGHMTFWADEAVAEIPRVAKGGTIKDYDIDRINDEVFRKNKRMSFVMLRPQLRDAEDKLINALRALSGDVVVDDEAPARRWLDVMLEHYDHHWPGLEEAVRRL